MKKIICLGIVLTFLALVAAGCQTVEETDGTTEAGISVAPSTSAAGTLPAPAASTVASSATSAPLPPETLRTDGVVKIDVVPFHFRQTHQPAALTKKEREQLLGYLDKIRLRQLPKDVSGKGRDFYTI